jgi:HAD superfamily hydrolase (TIGR01490 family)
VHCAGDVSFDPPVDGAFVTNVVGTRELLARIAEVGDHVHYVHVSTAYVAGRRRGTIAEGPVDHGVDVEAELAWGLAQRTAVEERSRDADRLARFRAQAEREHRRAGLLTAAAAVEKRRTEWVRDELVRLGTERARSLGWTDCYTFTKALGERVVEGRAASAPVSIVRPSIIESALQTPHAGWIEGFKMAEPLILAYGRGELPEFPAAGDTTIDVVPVDHVVAAIIAVLAHPPERGAAAYFHLSSGARNPLTYYRFYTSVRRYFEAHPFETGDRGATRLPDWKFPGAQSVERLLTTSERAHRAADRMIGWAPRNDRTRDLSRQLDRQGRRLEFLRRYLDLYHEYVVADLRFDDARTMALFKSLDADDRARFAFDTSVIDWAHYVEDIHCPAITAPMRRFDEARRKRKGSSAPAVRPAASAKGTRAAAFFDMDGTLLSSNVVETYLWSRLPELSGKDRVAELSRVVTRLPGWVRSERREREAFLRSIYRNYAGARLAELDAIVDESLTAYVLARVAPAAIRRVREHRAAGQPTVLITGAIRPLTRPLAPLFDHIEAVDLAVDDRGVCTGVLAGSPLVGEARAAWIRAWAAAHEIDLAASFGYADSYSDLPLLDTVGHPVAVRPDVPLFRHARRRHWPIVDWASPSATPRRLDPARAVR